MLQPQTQEKLELIKALENNYQPNQAIADTLADKTLIMVVGPAAVGKSTLMTAIAENAADFSRVSGFTSRSQRSNDEPGMYQYFEHSDHGLLPILDEISSRYVVQYAVHPTTYALYGSRIGDYRAPYNLLDTLSGVVEHLKSLPFAATVTIGIVTEPSTWKQWLFERYPFADEERAKRITEAILSLEWLLSQLENDILWLHNRANELAITAERLVRQVKGETSSDSEARQLAEACLDMARSLV